MKKILILFLSLALWSCNDDGSIISSGPVNLSSCFSPEFGTTESEQFFFDIELGELHVNPPIYQIKTSPEVPIFSFL